MDRRTLLAILLSTAVVLVFNLFILPKPEQRPPQGPGRAAESGAPTGLEGSGVELTNPPMEGEAGYPTEDGAAASIPTPVQDAEAEERTVRIETPLYRAEFSNRGAQVTSWELLSYADPFGAPVQLVSGAGELGIRVESEGRVLDLRSTLFRMREETLNGGARRVVFEAGGEGTPRVVKTFTLSPDSYLADMVIEIDGVPAQSSYQVGWDNGVPRSEKDENQYRAEAGAIVLVGDSRETLHSKKFKKEKVIPVEGNVRWAGARNKYFMAVVVPPAESSSRVLAVGDADKVVAGAWVVMPTLQGSARHEFKVYMGPIDYQLLKATGFDLAKAVNLGWKLFEPLSRLLLVSMLWMYNIVPNFGVVIILIAVATKLIFYPLTKSSVKSMRAMQKLQPKLTELREKYKNDPQKMNAAMMTLYKEEGVNPVGGCLPILLQMPVFIALYQALSSSIQMRGAEFMLWINDLSRPDTITEIGGFGIHVLPVILFGVTVLQQLWTPVGDSRQKMMGYMMPVVTLFIFYSFPAGLNLYWTVNSVMTAAQQWSIHREDPQKPAPAKPAKPAKA